MRAPSSVKVLSVVVVVSALLSGCSPDESDAVAVVPEPLAPEPEPEPPELRGGPGPTQDEIITVRQSQAEITVIRERRLPGTVFQVDVDRVAGQTEVQSSPVPQTPLRLVFQCTDGITFAVRMLSNALVLYPPGYPPNGSLILPQVPSASGVHYRASDIDFRSKSDLATLEMGRERYVDCVANPAAAVWQETLPRSTTPR